MGEPEPTATHLVLIRHGQSTWNDSRRVQGQRDDATLTPLGMKQAYDVAGSLRNETFDALYTSDLTRASHTASIIARELGLSAEESVDLRERNFGDMEGVSLDELTTSFSGIAKGWVVDANAHAPGGESLDELFDRCSGFVERITTAWAGRRILIITHGGTIRAIRAYVEGRTMAGLEWDNVTNCSTWRLTTPRN